MDLRTFEPRRILVCQLRQLGDVILTTPALELLHKRYPKAEIHVLTEAKCASLLETNPHVHHIWALDKKALRPLWREIAWYWHVARNNYDLVVDFQQLPRCRWVVAFSGAPVRLSYSPPWYTRLLYTHGADPVEGYAAQCKASVLAPLGIEWHGERPNLYLTESEMAFGPAALCDMGLLPEHTLVTLDPTHRQPTRRWPLESFIALVRLLHEARPDVRVLPMWGPGEEDSIGALKAGVPSGALLLPPRMYTLREMASCIACARLHVGGCSAPRHMAVAMGTPTCTIRGSTTNAWTFPSPEHTTVEANLPCQPCDGDSCPHRDCLRLLTPETVLMAVLEKI